MDHPVILDREWFLSTLFDASLSTCELPQRQLVFFDIPEALVSASKSS
jgi:hypothetical protein